MKIYKQARLFCFVLFGLAILFGFKLASLF